MREIAAVIVVSGLMLCAPAAFTRAETAPDNVPATPPGGGAAAAAAKPRSPADEKIAAIKDTISRTITSFENDIRDAYYRELIANPKIEGDVTVSFVVQPEGEITDAKVDRSSLNWPPLEDEILNRIRAWRFPPFEGQPIPAHVPYKFTPK